MYVCVGWSSAVLPECCLPRQRALLACMELAEHVVSSLLELG